MSSAHRHDPLVGALLDGRYSVVALLGRGGMGNIYVAEEKRLRRRCALKVLHPHLMHDPVHVERFLREAQIIAQFKHPNIVDIFASGEEPSGVVFFAMELLEGEDLDTRLAARAQRPFTTEDCCRWGIQVARAVGVVHAAGLIHRDLKTSNIYLARRPPGEDIVKLLDFGIARREERSELTGTGATLGTPAYMAPEQFGDGELDRRVDIYAFGVVLYRLLTGQLPFAGDAFQLALKHRDVAPARPSRLAPEAGIPAKLEAVVMKCMAKRPTDRYPSMQAVEDALVAVLHRPEAGSGVWRTLWARMPRTGPAAVVPGPVPCADSVTSPVTVSQAGETEPSAIAERRSGRSHLALIAGVFTVSTVLAGVWLMWPESGSNLVQLLVGGELSSSRAPSMQVDPAPGDIAPVEVAPAVPAGASLAVMVNPETTEASPSSGAPVSDTGTTAAHPPVTPAEPAVKSVAQRRHGVSGDRHAGSKPIDPIKQVQTRARACRRKFKAIDGLRIVVSYWVGVDGKVNGATPSVKDELGACLAAAVTRTRFEPKLELSKKIEL